MASGYVAAKPGLRADRRVASMRPPAVASGYLASARSMRWSACMPCFNEAASRGQRIPPRLSMRAPSRLGFNEAASRGQRIRGRAPPGPGQGASSFNEAASRGQRIRTNRKYPTRQRLRIVLRALPHHDYTRAARLSPARCGRCHHLSARTSSARLAPGRAPARPWRRLRGGAVLAFARLLYLVGALARPLAAGAGAVPGGVQLVGNLRP